MAPTQLVCRDLGGELRRGPGGAMDDLRDAGRAAHEHDRLPRQPRPRGFANP